MRSDARANRQDLVAAASRLLAEQGPGMSLRAVAQAAGVGVGTLYRHFPVRRDLLTAVLDHIVGRLTGHLERFLDGEGPLEERWRRLAADFADEELGTLLAARHGLAPADLPPADVMGRAEALVGELTEQAVARARDAGLVAPGVTGQAYFTGLITLSRRPLPELARYCTGDHRAWLLDVYLRGLRPA